MNNRPIKFRVWNKLRKSLDNDCNYSVTEYDPIKEYYDSPANCFLKALDDCQKDNNLIIQQYTGLTDKNNKEIYEGDIVEGDSRDISKHGHFSPIYQVIFQYGKFRLTHIKSQETSIDFSPHNYINTLASENLKIIGNIFENAELLNKNI